MPDCESCAGLNTCLQGGSPAEHDPNACPGVDDFNLYVRPRFEASEETAEIKVVFTHTSPN